MQRTALYNSDSDYAPLPWESRFSDAGEPMGVDPQSNHAVSVNPETLEDLESAGDILSDWQDYYGDTFTDDPNNPRNMRNPLPAICGDY